MKFDRDELHKFIKKVLVIGKFDGCYYKQLDNKYYIVFCWTSEDTLSGKIAYNADDLQCDYDFDWYMEIDKSTGRIIDTEVTYCNGSSAEELTNTFTNFYKALVDYNL